MNEDVRKNDQTAAEKIDPRPYMKGLTLTEIRAVELLARKAPHQSYREIANTLGISERYLRRIRDKRQVEYAVRERALEIQSEDLSDAELEALKKEVMGGNGVKFHNRRSNVDAGS